MPANIVLDTNCLIASLSKRGRYFAVWRGLQEGKFILCVSNEILAEYEEIITRKTNEIVAGHVLQTLINSPFVRLVTPYYHFHLIQSDIDDNKFVDCAIACNAVYLVSEDSHFNAVKQVPFPYVAVICLEDFLQFLQNFFHS